MNNDLSSFRDCICNSLRIEHCTDSLLISIDSLLKSDNMDIVYNLIKEIRSSVDTLTNMTRDGKLDPTVYRLVGTGSFGEIYTVDELPNNVYKIPKSKDGDDNDLVFYQFMVEIFVGTMLWCSFQSLNIESRLRSIPFGESPYNPFVKTIDFFFESYINDQGVIDRLVPVIGMYRLDKSMCDIGSRMMSATLFENIPGLHKDNMVIDVDNMSDDQYRKFLNAVYQTVVMIGYLQDSINFRHNDLHCGNVMVDNTNAKNIHFIDYGMSSFNLTQLGIDLTVSVPNRNYEKNVITTKSQDVRMFMASVLPFLKDSIFKTRLINLFNTYVDYIVIDENVPYFHNFYYKVQNINDFNFHPGVMIELMNDTMLLD